MTPTSERPDIPPGYGVATDADGLLAWETVATAVAGAEIYWLATLLPSGGPHLVPLHATALDGHVFLSGDEQSRWYRNLGADPRIQVGIEHDELQVMVRGRATHETIEGDRLQQVSESLQSKYGFSFDQPLPMWVVAPDTVLAFEPARFASSPTRFRFGGNA